jgi:hypothetical protein
MSHTTLWRPTATNRVRDYFVVVSLRYATKERGKGRSGEIEPSRRHYVLGHRSLTLVHGAPFWEKRVLLGVMPFIQTTIWSIYTITITVKNYRKLKRRFAGQRVVQH